jgi:hypothetical protein
MTPTGLMLNKPKRCVTLRRDGEDFIVVLKPEEIVAFRNADANALRKICAFLGWKIVSDTSDTLDMPAFLRR